MGVHTDGPDEGEPRRDPDLAAESPTDIRVAVDSGDDPKPADSGGDEVPAPDAPREAPPEPEPASGPEPAPEDGPKADDVRPRRPGADKQEPSVGKQLREGWQRVVGAIATGVVILSVVIAVFLALHIVFEVFEANEKNGIVEFVNGWATDLAYGFRDLFVPKDATIRVTVNYGLAAVVYLLAGRILAGIIRRLG